MSKAIKITLIVATACLVLGLILTTIAVSVVGFDVRRLSNVSSPVERQYTFEQAGAQRITVNGVSEDYRIVQGVGNKVEVTYYEDDQTFFNFHMRGETLVIDERHRPVFMFFNFDFAYFNREVIVVVPRDFSGDIEIATASGNIVIDALTGENRRLKVITASGDVKCASLDGDSLSINTASGNITCGSVDMVQVTLGSVSGDLYCDAASAESFELSTMSGDIRAREIVINSSSRQVSLTASSTSGDVNITVQGNEDTFWVSAKSLSGTINVPQGGRESSQSIELETLSGDIRLSFQAIPIAP